MLQLAAVNCLQDVRFSESRSALQTTQLFVSWIQYRQIPIRELLATDLLNYDQYSEFHTEKKPNNGCILSRCVTTIYNHGY